MRSGIPRPGGPHGTTGTRLYEPGHRCGGVGAVVRVQRMRLHFLIFAAMQGVPFAALPYASKVAGLLDDLAMESPPLGDTGVGQLIARIDHSWDTRDKLRMSIQEHLPQIRGRAENTNELLTGWLTGTGRMVTGIPNGSR